jgi:transcriptional regulator GlxA family with amidase domain
MKVAILNYKGVVPTSVSGPYDMLDKVKVIASTFNVAPKTTFDVDVINTVDMIPPKVFNVVGNMPLESKKRYDLVIIPAMNFNCIDESIKNESLMIRWIRQQYEYGSDIAAICLGTFILACTGLLNGKKATTHWMGAPYFKKLFPEVMLEDDKVIIDEERIYTCGAAYSFTTLMIYLIEKFCGRDIALLTSRVFMIQLHDTGQHAFSIFSLQHEHNDKNMSQVQNYIEKNYHKRLNVSRLAIQFNMSHRTFMFTDVTGNTPLEYIQRVRVEAAKRLLEQGRLTVEEISRKVGYEDFTSFRNIFKRFTSLTPQAYKKKYAHRFPDIVIGGSI